MRQQQSLINVNECGLTQTSVMTMDDVNEHHHGWNTILNGNSVLSYDGTNQVINNNDIPADFKNNSNKRFVCF